MSCDQACFAAALAVVFGILPDAVRVSEILAMPGVQTADFADGDVIFADGTPAALGVLVRGGAEIVRTSGAEGEVLLRTLAAGDAFGAATLFCAESAGTRVRAKGDARAVFLPRSAVEAVFAADPRAAVGYITFLSEKIAFLNARLATFTAENAEARLAGYILRASGSSDAFTPGMPLSRLAELLGLGRASLYRALDALCVAGAIEKEQRKIYIKKRAYLARVSGGTT